MSDRISSLEEEIELQTPPVVELKNLLKEKQEEFSDLNKKWALERENCIKQIEEKKSLLSKEIEIYKTQLENLHSEDKAKLENLQKEYAEITENKYRKNEYGSYVLENVKIVELYQKMIDSQEYKELQKNISDLKSELYKKEDDLRIRTDLRDVLVQYLENIKSVLENK